MSVNGNPGPDLNQQLLHAQQNASQATQGKGAPILLGYGDVQLTQFKPPPGICGADNKIMKLAQRNPGLLAKAGAAFRNSLHEDCKKAVQGVSIIYSGELPSGSPVNSGSSFAGGAGASINGGHEI